MVLWGVGFAHVGGEFTAKMVGDAVAMDSMTFTLFIATGLAAPVIGTAYAKVRSTIAAAARQSIAAVFSFQSALRAPTSALPSRTPQR